MTTLSIHDYDRNKLADLYCTDASFPGSAYNIVLTEELNGWKSLSFTVPRWIDSDGKHVENPSLAYLKNEFLVRFQEDGFTDWYLITLPTDDHEKENILTISCGHISSLLNRKKLYLVLDDTNGIGTAQEIASLILLNTSWA